MFGDIFSRVDAAVAVEDAEDGTEPREARRLDITVLLRLFLALPRLRVSEQLRRNVLLR